MKKDNLYAIGAMVLLLVLIIGGILLVRRNGDEATDAVNNQQMVDGMDPATMNDQMSPAPIDSIEIIVKESFPIQVEANVFGQLPSGCANLIEPMNIQRSGNIFTISGQVVTPEGAICTQALEPYRSVVPIDITGLPAGTYEVIGGGASATFDILEDNSIEFLDKG